MICKKIPLDAVNENVYLECFVSDKVDNFTRKAILVIPGGGYGIVCSDREGEPIALAFVAQGFNAFVLHYSVASNSNNCFPTQLIEAAKAIKYIKDNAKEMGHDADKVFVTGFSAGGHLCAMTGILWNLPEIYKEVEMPYGYNKPAGVMPIYPVVNEHSESFSNLLGTKNPTQEQLYRVHLEKHVTKDSSPVFIMHTSNDSVVPVSNSLDLARAYADAGLMFELHIYPDAPHGIALGNELTSRGVAEWVEPAIAKWVENAVYWAEKIVNKNTN